jgi:hypothetical protein
MTRSRARRWLAAIGVSALAACSTEPPTPVPDIAAIKADLVRQHGEAARDRINRGVDQVAALWNSEDGDLGSFVREHFIADPRELSATLARYESNLEQADGHMLDIGREFRRATDLDTGPLSRVDPLFASIDPSAHVVDDFFRSKLAQVALLNFPLLSLDEKQARGRSMTRADWAAVRLTGRFGRRVPAAVQQRITRAAADGELYISSYNIWMHHVVDQQGLRLFPKGKRLLSHWNLRDEIKANYADADGLVKQRVIAAVMARIVDQTIPKSVVDNPKVDWNPLTNVVAEAPAATVEDNSAPRASASSTPEGDVRYAKWLENFRAAKEADAYSPAAPTAIARAFDLGAELPEARVTAMLTAVLESPVVSRVASEVRARLGRPLEPHDIWFSGFADRGRIPERELDAKTRARYPTADAFAADMPRILRALDFAPARASALASRIRVEPARGSGHALQAARRGESPRLRTRIAPGGMDFKGYNIAVHELGHNVEQVLSLYDVDRTLLAGVPNTAFTEALAFVFQSRDLELLGYPRASGADTRLRVLNDFWATWEIAGVALVDLGVWHWLYEHPDASPSELRDATLRIARDTWNRYYAPVLGGKDVTLLAVYSHLVNYPLYLFNYPLGHIIAFQIEEHIAREGQIGPAFERMASFGAVTPDVWMEHATGSPVSVDPLLRAVDAALSGETAPTVGK